MLVAIGLVLSGCSAHVSGMQSPVLHDYGSIDWVPLTEEVEQSFVTGTGNSAAIENDPGTTPVEYLERQSQLPEDARSGDLQRLRVGLRLSGRDDAAWDTGARLQLAYADAQPLVDISIDVLPHSGERVEILELPEIEPGRELVLRLIPGSGPDAHRLQVGLTPGRAPYGGWRAVSGDEDLTGAIVFDTRYMRDVAVGDIVQAGIDRVADAGAVFLVLFGLTTGGLFAGALLLWRMPGRRAVDGR